MTDIKNQQLLYHLTSIKNIENILEHGLKPRNTLSDFVDVADSEILKSRKSYLLETYVPFHFFAKNPFDGKVQKDRSSEKFVLIAVHRNFAKSQNWKIIPCHPLANVEIELLGYDEGVNEINWELMESRDYSNPNCKSTCMAECLSPNTVQAKDFFSIYVCCSESEKIVKEYVQNKNLFIHININQNMFVK